MQFLETCQSRITVAPKNRDFRLQFISEGIISSQDTQFESLLGRLPCDPQSCSKVCVGCRTAMSARCLQGENNGYVTVITGAQPVTFSYTGNLLRSFEKRGA